jgi:hypothetical protein
MNNKITYRLIAFLLIFCLSFSWSLISSQDNDLPVSHWTISLFKTEDKQNLDQPVCDFIERLMLELTLLPDNRRVVRKLDEYRINIQYNGIDFGTKNTGSFSSLLKKIATFPSFTLYKTPEKYKAVWESGEGESLAITFPAERELITGINKKEADEKLIGLLKEYECLQAETPEIVSASSLESTSEEDIYRKKGDYFTGEAINANVYYRKQSNGRYVVLNDENYPQETLSNLFLGCAGDNQLSLNLKYRNRDNTFSQMNISLKNFTCFFRENFDAYCEVHKEEKDALNITLVLHHKDLNYIHIVSAIASAKDIFHGKRIINADFYSNISQHNLIKKFENND